MTSHLNLRHSHYCDPLPDPHTCLEHLRSYVAQVHLVEPASTWSKLRYYPVLRERGHLVIDGGYGEFGRRQFFNRVVRLGRAAVRARDGKGLIHLVRPCSRRHLRPGGNAVSRTGRACGASRGAGQHAGAIGLTREISWICSPSVSDSQLRRSRAGAAGLRGSQLHAAGAALVSPSRACSARATSGRTAGRTMIVSE